MTKRFLVVSALAVGVFVLGSCADNATGPATTPQTRSPVGMSTDLAVTGTDRLRFEPDALTAPAGEQVTITFSAESGVEHDFVVEGAADVGTAEATHGSEGGEGDANGDDLHVVHADPGQATTATFQIDEPGTYTVYCSVPGHRDGGMLATLTVVEGS